MATQHAGLTSVEGLKVNGIGDPCYLQILKITKLKVCEFADIVKRIFGPSTDDILPISQEEIHIFNKD